MIGFRIALALVLCMLALPATGRTYRTDLFTCSPDESPNAQEFCWGSVPNGFPKARLPLNNARTGFSPNTGEIPTEVSTAIFENGGFEFTAFDYPAFLQYFGIDPTSLPAPTVTVTRGMKRSVSNPGEPFTSDDEPLLRINWIFSTFFNGYTSFFEPFELGGQHVGVQLIFYGDSGYFELNGLSSSNALNSSHFSRSRDFFDEIWDGRDMQQCFTFYYDGQPVGDGQCTNSARAYLSTSGSDSNPCTLQRPCRLLPGALSRVRDGGEIWMLDSANYNTVPVTIARSVTIRARPGVVGSVVASGGDAIVVDGPNVKVTLRNLAVLNFNAPFGSGINFSQGAALTVENSEIFGMGNFGIRASAANGKLTVRDTVIRDNGFVGVYVTGTVSATLERVHVLNNSSGLVAEENAQVTISKSVVANNAAYGVSAAAFGAGTIKVTLDHSVLRANGVTGLDSFANGAGARAQVMATDNTISHNGTGVVAESNTGGTVTVVLGGNALVDNATGVKMVGAGTKTVYTRQSNTAKGNGTDLVGGALTPLSGL